ncbi:MAG: D-sedoheptulose-7-phosphate isomerase [Vulcanimicrobiaceae bacterium]
MDATERYLTEVETAIHAISRDDVRAVVEALFGAWERGRTIFILGNGGSAATASHMMNDLSKFTRVEGRMRVRAIALTDNVPLMTAYGNDQTFDDVFVEQLRTLMGPGDIVIAISGSGNSPNVIKAIDYAIENGARVVGLCGSPGGKLAERAHLRVIVPAVHIGQQEDGHLILNHAIAMSMRERIGRTAAGDALSPTHA